MTTIKFKAEMESKDGVNVEVLIFDVLGTEQYQKDILADALVDMLAVDTSRPYHKTISVEIVVEDTEFDG